MTGYVSMNCEIHIDINDVTNYEQTIKCHNWARMGPMMLAKIWSWSSSGTLEHWYWSTFGAHCNIINVLLFRNVISMIKIHSMQSIAMQCTSQNSKSNLFLIQNTVETLYSTIYYSKYFIELNIDKSTLYVALWTHKRHPIPRPFGRAMECLLWVLQQKLIVL